MFRWTTQEDEQQEMIFSDYNFKENLEWKSWLACTFSTFSLLFFFRFTYLFYSEQGEGEKDNENLK